MPYWPESRRSLCFWGTTACDGDILLPFIAGIAVTTGTLTTSLESCRNPSHSCRNLAGFLAMSMYGYEIIEILIVDIEPDKYVKKSMNEMNEASRLKVAAQAKYEAENIMRKERALGEAYSLFNCGQGTAWENKAIIDGIKGSVLNFSYYVPGTSLKDVIDTILVTQYFDTMKEIGASTKSTSVFIPYGPGAVKDVAVQITNGLIQPDTAPLDL